MHQFCAVILFAEFTADSLVEYGMSPPAIKSNSGKKLLEAAKHLRLGQMFIVQQDKHPNYNVRDTIAWFRSNPSQILRSLCL